MDKIQVPAEVEVYEKFLNVIRALKDQGDIAFLKAKTIKSLVHKIELKPHSMRIHYRVGQDEIEQELMAKEGSGAAMPPGLPARGNIDLDFGSRS